MKVDDLKSLANKVAEHLQKQNTVGLFHQFTNVLNASLQGNRHEPVSAQKDPLFASLRSFDALPLTYSEKGLFSVLGYDEYVGESAVRVIDAILHDVNFDGAGVIQKIMAKNAAFQQFVQGNDGLKKALQRVPSLKEATLRKGEALLEITFRDKAAVDNIVDFNNWIDSWTKIIRAFSQLAGQQPESSRVVFVQKSSPLIVDIATAYSLLVFMGKAIDAVLARVERYLAIRKQIEEIKKLKLENKKIEKSLEDEAEAFSEKSAQEITTELTAAMETKPTGEVVNFITISIRSLFNFVDKGGRVDCPSLNGDDTKGLNDVFTEIRKLQNTVDQLRLLPPPEQPEKTEK